MHRQVYLLYVLLLIYTENTTAQDGKAVTPAPVPTDAPTVTKTTVVLKTTVVKQAPGSALITYTCLNGKVTEMSFKNGNYTQVRVMKADGQYCSPTPQNKQGVIECINKVIETKNVTILYGEESTLRVIGGQNMKYFILSCTEKSVNKTLKISLTATQITKKPTIIDAKIISDDPVFKIKEGLTKVNVGEPLTLQMSIAAPHALQPEQCVAYKSNLDTSPYLFWDKCKTIDAAIIASDKWTKNSVPNFQLEIQMFAFKFIDSENVIISCSVTVCPTSEAEECKQKCPSERRRRRGTYNLLKKDSKVKTKTATIALQVLDNHIQQNGSKGITSVWYVIFLGIALTRWTNFKR